MKLPVGISGPVLAAIAGGVAIAGEVGLSHPAHQAIVIVAALVAGIIGYYTLPAGATSSGQAPPFAIPEPLPQPAPAAAVGTSRAAIDQAAAAAAPAERGLP